MPLADTSNARDFHDNHILSTGIYGGVFPNWKEVRLHYHRKVMLKVCDARAETLITALNLTEKDAVLLVGAGFGWLAECLMRRIPQLVVTCTDTSSWIHAVKNETETAEIDAIVQAAGILPGTEEYDTAMTTLDDGGLRARETILDLDILDTAARRRLGSFSWAITENVLPWLTDAEAVDLDKAMRAMAPKVAHLVTPFMDFDDAPPEPNPWNWKHLKGDAPTRASLSALDWYGTTSWKSLLPRSTIVGVGNSGVV